MALELAIYRDKVTKNQPGLKPLQIIGNWCKTKFLELTDTHFYFMKFKFLDLTVTHFYFMKIKFLDLPNIYTFLFYGSNKYKNIFNLGLNDQQETVTGAIIFWL
jgi:hypothetical protein